METDDTTDDERAIRELVDTWMAATEAGDVPTLLDLLTDDVSFLVPGEEPFGKAAFEATWAEMEGVRIEGTADVRELQVLGDWASLRNYLEVTVTPLDGGERTAGSPSSSEERSESDGDDPARRSGHTLTILRKESDGQWRLARDANLVTPEE